MSDGLRILKTHTRTKSTKNLTEKIIQKRKYQKRTRKRRIKETDGMTGRQVDKQSDRIDDINIYLRNFKDRFFFS